ncbi:PHP domain-containing protein [Kibdelosporangium aridum]|uniref:PHP domain-containing protein n=1 Tax=Kibdelosporangium aridum TaxID=2030 RepID=UPI0035EC2136
MGHHHEHGHEHDQAELSPAVDLSLPDEALSPTDLSRRSMLRRTGLLGAVLAGATVLSGAPSAAASPKGGFRWLSGDHHVHTQYSNDGKYRVADQVRHADTYGLDWLVITDHGNATHARIGVEKVNPDIVDARSRYPSTLVFQGLEWNIPAAEHGTVFVHPGQNEVALLRQFETSFDGGVRNATASTPANEALAIAGIDFLADVVRRRTVRDALMLANHPARKGIDSPHEIRNWRDAQPHIAVGMEGAPGHQAAGIAAPTGMGRARGLYDGSPGPQSFPGYPLESYRTFGGFDWMTATVGGLWDSLLAEGKPWWITANSDSHHVYTDTATVGPGSNYEADGKQADPVYRGSVDLGEGDFWPGYYSRTHVGASDFSYAAVMNGIRAGRVWVDHGQLIDGIDVRLRTTGRWGQSWATLGGVLHAKRGTQVELVVTIDLAAQPNWAQFVPQLARVDVIQGDVTGPAADRDTFVAPRTRVVKSFDTTAASGTVSLKYSLGRLDRPVYVRLRGTDGNRTAPGLRGAEVDPAGPAMDVLGNADPWRDLWFYTNPIWALPT